VSNDGVVPATYPFAHTPKGGEVNTMSDLRGLDAVQAHARAWVQANWDPSLRLAEWWRRLADAGYAAPELPIAAGVNPASRCAHCER